MEETQLDRYVRYVNEGIEEELMVTPSANRSTLKKMVSVWAKEFHHESHWGERLESTPPPLNPYYPSTSDLEVFARALYHARVREDADLDKR